MKTWELIDAGIPSVEERFAALVVRMDQLSTDGRSIVVAELADLLLALESEPAAARVEEAVRREAGALGVSDDLLLFGRCAAILAGEDAFKTFFEGTGPLPFLDLDTGDLLWDLADRPMPPSEPTGGPYPMVGWWLGCHVAGSSQVWRWVIETYFDEGSRRIMEREVVIEWARVNEVSDVEIIVDYRRGPTVQEESHIKRLGESVDARFVRSRSRVSVLDPRGTAREVGSMFAEVQAALSMGRD